MKKGLIFEIIILIVLMSGFISAIEYDFGGMYGGGHNTGNLFINPATGGFSCPGADDYGPAYTPVQITGACNYDYSMFYCYRPYTGHGYYHFGGVYGYGNGGGSVGGTYPNPYTGKMECPRGFISKQILGSTGEFAGDHPFYFCYMTNTEVTRKKYPFVGFVGSGHDRCTNIIYKTYYHPDSGNQCPGGDSRVREASGGRWGSHMDYAVWMCTGPAAYGQETITTCEELQDAKNNIFGEYVLGADIDCSATNPAIGGSIWGVEGFDPIGKNIGYFSGVFDGQGHKISGLYINKPEELYVGLFGVVGSIGIIKNVGLANVNITGRQYVGGIAGSLTGGLITDSYSTGSLNAWKYVGGITAKNQRGTINNSYSAVSITATAEPNRQFASGLAGSMYEGTCPNSFWDTQIAGPLEYGGHSGCGTEKTTAEMKTITTFTDAGWDFINTWKEVPNDYPRLILETPSCIDTDGGLIYTEKGRTGAPGNQKEDSCENDFILAEFTCSDTYDGYTTNFHICLYGCEIGKCGEPPSSYQGEDCFIYLKNDRETCLDPLNNCTWTPPEKTYEEGARCCGYQEEWVEGLLFDGCEPIQDICYVIFDETNIKSTAQAEFTDETTANLRFEPKPQYCEKISAGDDYGIWQDVEVY